MLRIKQEHLDHFAGFSLALLVAFPMLRVTILPLPGIALVIPIIFLLTVGMLCLYRDGTKRLQWNVVIYIYMVFLLFLYLLISALWNVYDVNLNENIINILFIGALIFSVAIAFNKRSVDYFLHWMVVFAVFTTFTYIYHYINIGSFRGYGIPAYLTRSLILGMGAIIAISKLLFFENVNNKLYASITVFLFFGLSISLGRAALLASSMISLILIAVYYRNNWPKSYSMTEYFKNKSSLIVVLSILGVLGIVVTQIERTFNRLIRLFTGREFTTQRVDLWKDSVIGFFDAPIFGHGLSSSGPIIEFNYPHNMYLQVLVEGGIFAFILLIIISLYPILKTYLLNRRGLLSTYVWIPLISCYVFLIINFSLAINFYEGRVLVAMGLVMVILLNYIRIDKKVD